MTTPLARIRQPEYTGENRCLPCTVVNVVIALVLAAGVLLAVGAVAGTGVAVGSAAALFLASLAAIALRGYLVPGTPELTKRYLPRTVLEWFGKAPGTAAGQGMAGADATADDDASEEVEPEPVLTDAGVLVPCANEDDLCLEEDFGERWRAAIREARESGTDRERLLAVLGVDDLDVEFVETDSAFWARTADGRRVGSWESRAAFHADVAAAPLLADRLDGWETYDGRTRSRLLNGLRLFLDVCPACEATLRFDTETVESCCTSYEVAALSCESCGVRLFESNPL